MASMVNVEELRDQMEAEYCPPVDTGTFLAIITDYDLSSPTDVKAARTILDMIRQDAEIEEATGFDPSGSGGVHTNDEKNPNNHILHNGRNENRSGSLSAMSQPGSSSVTDDTSLSQGMSSLDLEGLEFDIGEEGRSTTFTDSLEALDEESKEGFLLATFPVLSSFDVKFSMKRAKGDINIAINDLLTQAFLEETGSRRRGIEAFTENHNIPSKSRKKKGKRRNGRREDASVGSPIEVSLSAIESKWETGRTDVEFICNKTGMPMAQVSSLYHKNGASVRATLLSMIESYPLIDNDDLESAQMEINSMELGRDFPSLNQTQRRAIIQMSHPSTSNAHELAKALCSTRGNTSTKPTLQIEFRHPELNLETVASPSKSRSINALHRADLITPTSPSAYTVDPTPHLQARNTYFNQAASSYRKSKSDHLMGGAAAYYSQLGRDADAKVKVAEAAAADRLAETQSTRDGLDLHGLGVRDAVRIVRERVGSWWRGVQEERRRYGVIGREAGYRIVTGVGYHSEGGKGKLGPAVAKMLIREGWKVQVGTGVLIVTGVVR